MSFLVVVLTGSIGLTAELGQGKYKPFLEKQFSDAFKPKGEIYKGWVEGLKQEKDFDLNEIAYSIEIVKEEELTVPGYDKPRAFVLFILTIKAYCRTSSGDKMTVISVRSFAIRMKVDASVEEDVDQFVPIEQATEIFKGWNGEQDI